MSQILQANTFPSMKPFLVGKKPKDRRHVLAAFSQKMKRIEEEKRQQAACYPGPMPVEAVNFNQT